jgi:hypothetical protein
MIKQSTNSNSVSEMELDEFPQIDIFAEKFWTDILFQNLYSDRFN